MDEDFLRGPLYRGLGAAQAWGEARWGTRTRRRPGVGRGLAIKKRFEEMCPLGACAFLK